MAPNLLRGRGERLAVFNVVNGMGAIGKWIDAVGSAGILGVPVFDPRDASTGSAGVELSDSIVQRDQQWWMYLAGSPPRGSIALSVWNAAVAAFVSRVCGPLRRFYTNRDNTAGMVCSRDRADCGTDTARGNATRNRPRK